MLKLFNRESTYLVLLQDADLQAYRTDRFEGWVQQPAGTGPVLFTNTSPSYVNLSVIGAEAPEESATAPAEGRGQARRRCPPDSSDVTSEATADSTGSASATSGEESAVPISDSATESDSDDGGSNTGLIIGIAIAALVVVGIVVYAVAPQVLRRRPRVNRG